MAGDWIKMRVSLVTHPRVIALSEALSYLEAYQDWSGLHGFIPALGGTKEDFDAGIVQSLRVTRYVVVTALLKFWGYANEHSKDDFIPNLRIADLDEITSVPGFGAAISEVGWAIYDQDRRGISLPNFAEHNATASDRTNAERQKRYRERQKVTSGKVTENSNVTDRNESNDREEKRREDTSSAKTAVAFSAGAWSVPDALRSTWESAYPAVDIDAELAKASAWLLANPKNRKSNYARFLNSWLTKAQDSAPRAAQTPKQREVFT